MKGEPRGTRRPIPQAIAQFWDRIDKSAGLFGCWQWTGAIGKDGYGRAYFEGQYLRAHRFAWMLQTGAIPTGLVVCHTCDNPPCCNPAHLFLGTIRDNARDMVAKGRALTGERNPNAVLTLEQVRELRGMPGPLREVARAFGVSERHVLDIRAGRRWAAHV